MNTRSLRIVVLLVALCGPRTVQAVAPGDASEMEHPSGATIVAPDDHRLDWWREARFGMFIHWGLYAIPAGEWNGGTNHAEWIRHTAQIPVEVYDQFVDQFNPVKFDANEWVRAARDAGMRYIVITSKHHDGFCLFDSAETDFDVMSTPFRRDILKELSDSCRREGLRMCWYHSIMDWHHPDYLPRRAWEAGDRPDDGAELDRYVAYMKRQLRELLTNYGPIGVLWFDGEWENSWTHERGQDLYDYVRSLQPDIIINNRVDVGRGGMGGMTRDEHFAGDFGTPEQEVPSTGVPGVDWESCITMNAHWGYNRRDMNYKSSEELIRMLVDIASKGGNLLLNVGPKPDGTFPQESLDRLRDIGRWMKVNDDSIYGTGASPFKALAWGRCTSKPLSDGRTRLFLHVFDWPGDGRLVVPGILNDAGGAFLLSDAGRTPMTVRREEDALVISVPAAAPDAVDSVVVLDVVGTPDTPEPPTISAAHDIFVDVIDVDISSARDNVVLRFTIDGSTPNTTSPEALGSVRLTRSATVRARAFLDGKPVSGVSEAAYTRVEPRPAETPGELGPGLRYEYVEGEWDTLPGFDRLRPVKTGVVGGFEFTPRDHEERFGFRYRGYVRVPRDGVYTFSTISDDGSRLFLGDELVVDNDGLHSAAEARGTVALARGLHPITVTFFERTGGDMLEVWYEGPGLDRQQIPGDALAHD